MRHRASLAMLVVGGVFAGLALAEVAMWTGGFQQVPTSANERKFFVRFDPVLGWWPLPNLTARHEKDGFSVIVRQNQFGLRGPTSMRRERTDDSPRTLVLGDSYVWGHGVEQDALLTDPAVHRSDRELLNFGVSGYGTDQELLLYERLGEGFDVDEVVLVFTPYNDVDNNLRREAYGHWKPRFELEAGELVLHTEHVRDSRLLRLSNWLRFHLRVVNLLDRVNRLMRTARNVRRQRESIAAPRDAVLDPAPLSDRDRNGVAVTLRIIERIHATATARGADFAVAFVPYEPHVRAGVRRSHPMVGHLADALSDTEIEILDPHRLFVDAASAGGRLFNEFDPHFSAEGHALMSRVLVDPAVRVAARVAPREPQSGS